MNQQHIRPNHSVSLFILCLSLSMFLSTPTYAEKAGPKLQSIYLFRQGNLIGYSFQFKIPYPMTMMVNAAHQIQWFHCKLPHATLLISSLGTFRIEEILPHSKLELTFSTQGTLSSIGQIKFKYDSNGRLHQFGKTKLSYNMAGRINKIGEYSILYGNDRKLSLVGKTKMKYRAEGRLLSIAGIQFKYRMDGKIVSIGKLTFTYDPTRHTLSKAQGSESRAKVRFAWTAQDIYRILRRKK